MAPRYPLVAVAAATAFALLGPPGAASAAPTRHEAEGAALTRAAVESNHAGFSGTGFVDFDNTTGSSAEFTVTADRAGPATLTVRYANGSADDRPMDVAVDGVLAVDDRPFPATGAWTSWWSATEQVVLKAGRNRVRLTSAAATGGPNVDYLEVEQAAAVTEHQSEAATIVRGAVESDHAGFTGTGFVDYDNTAGGYVEYAVDAARAGAHTLVFRYANGSADDRPLSISVDGGPGTALSFPGTGAWTTWREVTATATLKAGRNRVRATATGADGGPNADRLTVAHAGPADTRAPSAPGNLRSTGKTATSVALAWDAATDDVGVVGYDIYQHGQLMRKVDGTTLSATVTGLTPDTEYDWTVFARDAAPNVSPASNNVVVRTDQAPPDAVAPTAPSGLRVTGRTATSVDLAWTASTDDVGVTGYEVFRDGARAGTADGTTTTVGGLTTGTSYRFTVRARDAAGNLSPFSAAVTATPGGSGPGGVPEPGAVATVASGVDVPWGLAFLPDGSALVTEREKFTVQRLAPSGARTTLGKVPGAQGTGGEGGVLGIEVSPTFASDGHVFVYHTAAGGNQLVRAKLEGDRLTGWKTLLSGVPKSRYHNGGRLRFSPDGRHLFVSTGDAQNDDHAQNLNTNAGKILRIHPDGSIPADNPFPGKAVWSYGHRNVQGLAFDSRGRLWASEFGDSKQDEVNLIEKGGNFGWPGCEGTTGSSCAGTVAPKKTWSTSTASPSGLAIVDDHLFVATTVGQRLYRLRIDASANLVEQKSYFQGTYGRLRTVEVDRAGDLWLTTTTDKDGTAGNDRVLRVDLVHPGESGPASAGDGAIPATHACAGSGAPGRGAATAGGSGAPRHPAPCPGGPTGDGGTADTSPRGKPAAAR
ncbi:PQQ-dependent sugar dehydrogenase [Saccharothrix australiensis]|uniref:Glucose/arabinose dehydrogenase n=1 Tax=Saccharothrix australiensis TaxID=2072 RepID=A0A495W5C8_9PSEU|nr:PQQ-dependent sugar dehydrogenase [Saccharothrix australiensis]RKT55995.1 glucose/arabinose dehydrogenase [Saccharothrix australiensis]